MAERDIAEEIEDIIVDAYDIEEQIMSWEVAFQDRVKVPFDAAVLGSPVQVHGFRAEGEHIQCLVIKGEQQRWIGVEALDDTNLPADFARVLELYDAWESGEY